MATKTLVELGEFDQEVEDVILQFLLDDSNIRDYRFAALELLCNDGIKKHLAALYACAHDKDWFLRKLVIEKLFEDGVRSDLLNAAIVSMAQANDCPPIYAEWIEDIARKCGLK